MATVVKTIENVDSSFAEIVVNGVTYESENYVAPEEDTTTSTSSSEETSEETEEEVTEPVQGQDVKAINLNNIIHNIKDEATALALSEEVTARENAVNLIEGIIGQLSALETTIKTDIVSAVNEVNSKAGTAVSDIGNLQSLTTSEKNTLVGAINEVDSEADTNTQNIGTLSNLNTTDKSDVVSAINEVNYNLRQIPDGIVPKGTIAFASLPSLSSVEIGWMYNISDDFTTTSDFITPNVAEKAGSNVYCADIGSGTKKWDVFAVAPDIVVDQTYDGTSTNPQSGTAVKQAFDANTGLPMVECLTAYNETAKVVDLPGFVLAKGATLLIKFTNNTATLTSNRTLNVNGTGALALYVNGSRSTTIPTTATTTYYPVTYDGSYWQMETSYVNYIVRKYGITGSVNNTNNFDCWSSMTLNGNNRYFRQTNLSAGDGISVTSSSSAPKVTYTVKLSDSYQQSQTFTKSTTDATGTTETTTSVMGVGNSNYGTALGSILKTMGERTIDFGGDSLFTVDYTYSTGTLSISSNTISSTDASGLASWLACGEGTQSETSPHYGTPVEDVRYRFKVTPTGSSPTYFYLTPTAYTWNQFQTTFTVAYSSDGTTDEGATALPDTVSYAIEGAFTGTSSNLAYIEYLLRNGGTIILESYVNESSNGKICCDKNMAEMLYSLVPKAITLTPVDSTAVTIVEQHSEQIGNIVNLSVAFQVSSSISANTAFLLGLPEPAVEVNRLHIQRIDSSLLPDVSSVTAYNGYTSNFYVSGSEYEPCIRSSSNLSYSSTVDYLYYISGSYIAK